MSGGPMNMEEWQRRMKAEKDAARKKKSESTEILHGYRGGVRDEELKLKKLREEERQRQLDAEKNLHSYQAKEIDGIKQKTPRNQQAVQADASSSANKNYMEGFDVVAGSVSERAAALAASRDGPHGFQPDIPDIPIDTPVEVHHPAEEAEDLIPEPIPERVLGESESDPQEMGAATAANDRVDEAPNMVEDISEVLRTRTNVLFSFGVVSIHTKPDLSGYMVSTEKVVADCIARHPGITCDPKAKPFVRTCIPDASYIPRLEKSNTKRSLVTAAVPITFDHTLTSRANAKQVIVAALQEAIQSGSFLELAQAANGSI